MDRLGSKRPRRYRSVSIRALKILQSAKFRFTSTGYSTIGQLYLKKYAIVRFRLGLSESGGKWRKWETADKLTVNLLRSHYNTGST
jgi:hypothetical protein